MKLKLDGSFAVRNIVSVKGENGEWYGDIHIRRNSGWRGGPTYAFYPSNMGAAVGLDAKHGAKVKEMLKELEKELP